MQYPTYDVMITVNLFGREAGLLGGKLSPFFQ